jgi:cytochrome c oxidase subunit 2
MKRFALALVIFLGGCSGDLAALDPAGPAAAEIKRLTLIFVGTSVAVYVVTLIVFFLAVRRSTVAARTDPQGVTTTLGPERGKVMLVAAAVALTVVILSVLVGVSTWTDRRLIAIGGKPSAEIDITARRWWWEIRYNATPPSEGFVTANELHIPAGEPVQITLNSADVIHSFWVPNVTGKRDVIPGRTEQITLRADRIGTWTGRCAEFCGLQHARTNFIVIVEPRAEYDRWRKAQAQPARTPTTPEEIHGQQVFAKSSCGLCHAIRGSGVGSYSATAPDLTHLKSRSKIAAGTLPNTKGYLAGWVADAPSQKPGVLMPVNLLPPNDFQALLAYLESLQ